MIQSVLVTAKGLIYIFIVSHFGNISQKKKKSLKKSIQQQYCKSKQSPSKRKKLKPPRWHENIIEYWKQF